MRIELKLPAEPSAPLPPPHPHYVPTMEFVERHGLHVDESEVWVFLADVPGHHFKLGDPVPTKWLRFDKDTGYIQLHTENPYDLEGENAEPVVSCFAGYLPNEDALEQIIKYTNW